jgi:uncharacterized membrane protein
MEFEASRILSAVGAVLLAVGSFISGLGIVGVILLLVGLKGLADAYRDEAIFKNALYALIFEVAASGAFLFIFFGAVFGALRRGLMGQGLAGLMALLAGFGLALAAATALLAVGAYFYRKSFIALSARSREPLFETSGLLLLIGAILTIILIGRFVTLAAWAVAAVAFFTLPPPQPPPSPIEAQPL